jgi:outer membrane immunogenic protein
MKKVLLTSVATGALALAAGATGALTVADSANAADLRMPLKAPPPPAPVYSWSGCYVGAHWGWGWGKSTGQGISSAGTPTSFGSFDTKVSGPIFGGQLGCNYQWPTTNFVVGIEGMIAGADINGNGVSFKSSSGWMHNKIDSLASITGRIGWNGWDPMVLFYVKGGWAWAHQKNLFQPGESSAYLSSHSFSGWTVGGGVEWAFTFAPRWSAFVEYDYYSFGHKTVCVTSITTCTDVLTSVKTNVSTVKVGINYKLFSPF